MLKSIWNRMHSLRCIYVFLVSFTLSHVASNRKSLNYKLAHDQKYWTPEIPKKKVLNPQEKYLDPRKTHEKKGWTQEIPTKKFLNPQNTHKKKLFGPMKYTRKKFLNPQNAQKQEF